jgi:hypothetical protein
MSTRKDALMEELIMQCEIRGELDEESNKATELRIAQIERELAMTEVEETRYTLWKTGYNVQRGMYVEMVSETPKAYKFKCMDSAKEYTFFLPKAACRFDKNVRGIINLANWFNVEGFLSFLFDRYATIYKR